MPREILPITLDSFLDQNIRLYKEIYANVPVGAPLSDLTQAYVQDFCDALLSGLRRPNNDLNDEVLHLSLNLEDDHRIRADDLKLLRDVDSVLVMSQDFLWTGAYDLHMTFRAIAPIGTLHCDITFGNAVGDQVPRDPGHDSALWWAQCGPAGRTSIFLMLPNFEQSGITQNAAFNGIYAMAYNTVVEQEPDLVAGWCPSYFAEQQRAKFFKGGQARASEARKAFDSVRGAPFATAVMALLRNTPFGADAYWLIQVRGAKDLTRHGAGGDYANVEDMADLLLLEVAHTAGDYVFVDVGVEIHPPSGFGVLALRDQHNTLVAQLLSTTSEIIDEGHVHIDPWAGTAQAAGGRWNFTSNPVAPGEVSYFQLYTSDKAPVYNASHAHKIPLIPGMKVLRLKKDDPHGLANLAGMHNNLDEMATANSSIVLRAEARVPYAKINHVFRGLSRRGLRPLIIIAEAQKLWTFRQLRCAALMLLMRSTALQSPLCRGTMPALTLAAATIYMWNATHRAPPSLQHDRTLCTVVFPCDTQRARAALLSSFSFWTPMSLQAKTPYMERGAMWLPPIKWPDSTGNVLRFHGAFSLTYQEAAQIFNTPWAGIKSLFTPAGTALKDLIPRQPRVRGKSVCIEPRVITLEGDFDLPPPPTAFDFGDDLAETEYIGEDPEHDTRPKTAGALFLSIISEMLQRVGSSRDGTVNYCRLSQEQRKLIGMATFQDPCVGTYFESYYWIKGKPQWTTVQGLVFPSAAKTVNHHNNKGWMQLPSWQLYIAYRDHPVFDRLNKFCMRQFNDFHWFPFPCAQRVWEYTERKGTWKRSGPGQRAIAIVWNPTKLGQPLYHRNHTAQLDPAAIVVHEQARADERAEWDQVIGDEARLRDAIHGPRPPSPELAIDEILPTPPVGTSVLDLLNHYRTGGRGVQDPNTGYNEYWDPREAREEEEEEEDEAAAHKPARLGNRTLRKQEEEEEE
ncbi:hypothetical protein B0H13DRAFT_2659865 [Mycena leptocephala]|nr:hypothetical protein B0H13DRAFT_2659865 [Mycena leptocephala]